MHGSSDDAALIRSGETRTRLAIVRPDDGLALRREEHSRHAAIAPETRFPLHRGHTPRPAGRKAGWSGFWRTRKKFVSPGERPVSNPDDAMTTMDLDILTPTERDQVERWRARELERAGFSVSLARKLAARLDIDLHLATDLIRSGCPPELAIRILL
jgi:hypothetical protein